MNRKTEYTRESDLEYYPRRYFNELKHDYHRLQISNSTFRCPFCFNRDYYSLSDLLRHASRMAGDVHGETVKEIAKHSALERYLDSKISENKSHDMNVNAAEDELFVWPWKVVLANNVTKIDPKSGKYIGKSRKEIKEKLLEKGFHPLKVHTPYNKKGQTKFAIVEFGKEWDGFSNALMLERRFEAQHCGKRDYLGLMEQERGDKLFGWVARSDDYNSRDIVGKYLWDNGDLKTVSGKEAEDNRKALLLESYLTNTLKQKKKELEEATRKCGEANQLPNQKEEMLEHFNKDNDIEINKFAETSKRKFPAEGNWKAAKIKLDDERKMKARATQWCSQRDDYQGNSKKN